MTEQSLIFAEVPSCILIANYKWQVMSSSSLRIPEWKITKIILVAISLVCCLNSNSKQFVICLTAKSN